MEPVSRRRRGAALEELILEAAWEELSAVGYAQTSIAGVAARAQTGKQVLYRRWRNRAELAVAAVNHHVGPFAADPADTGSLRGDLLALLAAAVARVSAVDPGVLLGILSEFADEDDVIGPIMPSLVAVLLDRAVARGELTPVRVPDRVLSLPGELARAEIARAVRRSEGLPEPLSPRFAEIVDQVFLPLVRAYAGETP
ncbi:TetR/AcrR family transcriptional regulator [Catenuloplanes japonicus]|uniref:TetR/AcrR family transcriptional regulator n=1 Tax=Catenuloplanes japonicus TaxID=33876 RepID=UPI0005278E92|nr:TetR/AcrR family transcriptional regulator [Catenuloplanes japonicus]